MTIRGVLPRAFLASSVGLALLLALPATAQAHALLIRSQPNQGAVVPREPPVIHLWFSEALNASLSKAIVWNARRQVVDLGDDRVTGKYELTISLRAHLPDGTYLVIWTSVSAQDGHVLKSAFLFSIGHRGPAPPAPGLSGSGTQNFPPDAVGALSLAARAVELLAEALWLGLALVMAAVIRRQAQTVAARDFRMRAFARAALLLPVTLAALVLSRCVTIAVQAYLVTGSWSSAFSGTTLNGLLLQTQYGHAWLGLQAITLLGLVVATAMLTAGRRKHGAAVAVKEGNDHPKGGSPRPSNLACNWMPLALLVLACTVGFLTASSGHAATVNLAHTGTGVWTAPVALDWLHVLATGIWTGGICAISLVLIPTLLTSGRAALIPFLDALDRFSPYAYAAVLTLFLTGGFSGVVHIPSWDAFFTSIYGRTLIVKMSLILFMILISAFTVGFVRPRMRRAIAKASGTSDLRLGYLQAMLVRWLRLGAVLTACVFAATAVLNAYPVPLTFGAHAGPFVLTRHVSGAQVSFGVTPGKAGPDTFTVNLKRNGRPVPLASVAIVQTMLDMNMGTQYLTLNQAAPGRFIASGQIAMGGHWEFLLQIRLPRVNHFILLPFKVLVSA